MKLNLLNNFNITKLEKLILKSFEEDDLENFLIIFQRVSKHIYFLFKDLEIEYKDNIINIENIVIELMNGSKQLFDEYYKSNDDFIKFYNYIRIKSFRNCLEDILLINEKEKNIVFANILNDYFEIKYICNDLYNILDKDNIFYKNYSNKMDFYIENNFTK